MEKKFNSSKFFHSDEGEGPKNCETPIDRLDQEFLKLRQHGEEIQRQIKASEFNRKTMQREIEMLQKEKEFVEKQIAEADEQTKFIKRQTEMQKTAYNAEQIMGVNRELEAIRRDLENQITAVEKDRDRLKDYYHKKMEIYTKKWSEYKAYKESKFPEIDKLQAKWTALEQETEKVKAKESVLNEKKSYFFKLQCEKADEDKKYGIRLNPEMTIVHLILLKRESEDLKRKIKEQMAKVEMITKQEREEKEGTNDPSAETNARVELDPGPTVKEASQTLDPIEALLEEPDLPLEPPQKQPRLEQAPSFSWSYERPQDEGETRPVQEAVRTQFQNTPTFQQSTQMVHTSLTPAYSPWSFENLAEGFNEAEYCSGRDGDSFLDGNNQSFFENCSSVTSSPNPEFKFF